MDRLAAPLPAGESGLAGLATDLRTALTGGGVGLWIDLQPICAAGSLAPVGQEAMLRWEHPVVGAVRPLDILAAAESAGLAASLETWVLTHAFRLRPARAQATGFLAVNLSAGSVVDGTAATLVQAALHASGADPRGLMLELPEAAMVQDLPAARRLATILRDMGLALALDHFGLGPGAARALRDIPFAALKLDAGLIAGLEGTGPVADRGHAMVTALAELAHAMGATAIADGVETACQVLALRDSGYDALQGRLLGLPIPATLR